MKRLYLSAAASALAFAFSGPSSAQSTSTTIFLVDESGSMAGEQTFLQQFVLDLDPALAIAGISTRNYGLIGFSGPGTGPANLREFTIGTTQLGTAQDFSIAAQSLVTTGSIEDGYSAIDYVLKNYPVSNGATFVLVTDEDRDDTDSSLSYASILSSLQAAGVNLVSMLDVTILNANGDVAIATDGTDALTQDGVTFDSVAFGSFSDGFGTTIADYANLSLAAGGGCVADLNQLRLGGEAAAAFAAAFQTCVVNAVTDSGIVAILALPIRDASLTVAQNIRLQLRMLAQAMSNNGTGGIFSTQGADVIDDMFGVKGLRGYGMANASFGSVNGGDDDLNSQGLSVGLDYTYSFGQGIARFGGAVSFVDATVDGDGSNINTSAQLGQLYGVYRTASGLQFTGDMQFGTIDSDTARRIGATSVTGSAESDYRSISFEAGKRFQLQNANAVLMPFGGLQYEKLDQDSYTESNGGEIPDFTQALSTARLGLRYEVTSITSAGTWNTMIDASFNHIYAQDIDVGSGTVPFSPGDVDENRFDLGVNFGLEVSPTSRVMVSLGGSKSEDTVIGSVGLGFQMTF
ncbi:autotransporter domain-containing protein [Puniceibacterium antarcticum]|nr:autotransporter domain-containing protein [Puniceibacterium antarcticum]